MSISLEEAELLQLQLAITQVNYLQLKLIVSVQKLQEELKTEEETFLD